MNIFRNKIISTLLLIQLVLLLGQTARTQTVTQSYVRTWTAAAPETDPANLITRPVSDARQVTQYFDGLGKLMQTSARQGSLATATGNNTDLVTISGYDNIGRLNMTYRPYVSTSSDGTFQTNAGTAQPAYYNNGTNPLAGQGENGANAHNLVVYESSPLNRPILNMDAGNSWVGTNTGVATGYWSNMAADAVMIWNITDNGLGVFGTYATAGQYPAGTLFKKSTVDENGNQVLTFTDLQGQVILKKVAQGATDNGSGSGYTGWLCTYYIYDYQGNLRCVIQPAGVQTLSTNGWNLTANLLAGQCFRYEYDARNRQIMKQVPDAQPLYQVYDNIDRVVMSQDGNLRNNGQWAATIYDNVNRPVETGLLQDANTLTTELGNAYNSVTYPSTSGMEVLTVTHYDDYSNIPASGPSGLTGNFQTAWNGSFAGTNTSDFPYPVMPAQNSEVSTKGLVTWTQSEVIGSGGANFLTTVNIYDDKSRVVQTQRQNYTGGIDVTTTQYTWAGQPLVVVQSQQKAGSNVQTNVLQSNYSYDVLGRPLNVIQSLTGPTSTISRTVLNNSYNELGQLAGKTLGNGSGAGSGPIDQLSYDYNIRGWLLGIDRPYLNSSTSIAITGAAPSPGNYFAEELAYDKLSSVSGMSYTAAQLNGNIAGIVWKSTGDAVARKYDFTYDPANRLTAANFTQLTPGNAQAVDFSSPAVSYDPNGNITAMSLNGYLLGAPTGPINQMGYTYYPNSNELQNVVDMVNNPQTELGNFRSSSAYLTALGSSKTPLAYDYAYDANGNLTVDQNKDMGTLNNGSGAVIRQGITYNYLNLPSTITLNAGKGTIRYVYDAGGNKLQKITTEQNGTVTYNGTTYNGVQIVTTTTYIDGFVYQSVAYPNNAILNASPLQHGDILQFAPHAEGRIRAIYANTANSNTLTGYAFDYFLKDHLGDTRMVLTDEQASDPPYLATMEPANAAAEKAVFGNIASTQTQKPGAFDNDPNNQSVALTNFTTNKVGPSLLLKVMAGDQLAISVNAYYNASSGSHTDLGTLLATDLLASLLSPATGVAAASEGRATLGDLQSNSGVIGSSAQDFLNNRTPLSGGVPQAYLNYLFLDDQFQFAGGYATPITSACATAAQLIRPSAYPVAVPKNGYAFIYVSNESDYNVYFDNLQVLYQHGPILEDNAYYPFGLAMAGISDKAVKTQYATNKFRYNGKELQNQEFSDGSGLEEYDFGARFQDPQLGRWLTQDPHAEKYISASAYSYGSNDPVIIIDPTGKDAIIYDEKGRKVATYHNDQIRIERGMEKSSALMAFQSAVKYVDGKTNTYKDIFKSKSVVNFHIGNYEDNTAPKVIQGPNGTASIPVYPGNNQKLGAQTVDINWNPNMALQSSDGGVNSPALNLLHEAIHGDHAITDLQAYLNNNKRDPAMGNYDTREEYNTIQEVNSVASKLPLENAYRADHRGDVVPVAGGVTSTFIPPKVPPPAIDKTKNVLFR